MNMSSEDMGQVNPVENTVQVTSNVAETAVVKATVEKNYARKYTKGSKMVMLSLRIPQEYKQMIKEIADRLYRGNMTEAVLRAVNGLSHENESPVCEDTAGCGGDTCSKEKAEHSGDTL